MGESRRWAESEGSWDLARVARWFWSFWEVSSLSSSLSKIQLKIRRQTLRRCQRAWRLSWWCTFLMWGILGCSPRPNGRRVVGVDFSAGEVLIHEQEVREFEACSFKGMNLAERDFSDITFRNCDFAGANLCGANLSRARILGSNLRGAQLVGAGLEESDLSGTDISRADIRSAYFRRARLAPEQVGQAGRASLHTVVPPSCAAALKLLLNRDRGETSGEDPFLILADQELEHYYRERLQKRLRGK